MRTRHLIVLLPLFFACLAGASGETASPAPAAPAADPSDLARQLADAQDKLSAALRSYSLLQDENAQLKADADKSAAEKSALTSLLAEANGNIAVLKTQAADATQVYSLRTQLRQAQDEVASLAAENARLKTRLAVRGPAPSGGLPAPTRPASP